MRMRMRRSQRCNDVDLRSLLHAVFLLPLDASSSSSSRIAPIVGSEAAPRKLPAPPPWNTSAASNGGDDASDSFDEDEAFARRRPQPCHRSRQ